MGAKLCPKPILERDVSELAPREAADRVADWLEATGCHFAPWGVA